MAAEEFGALMEMPAIASSTYTSTPLNVAQLLAGGAQGLVGGNLDRRVQAADLNQYKAALNQVFAEAPAAPEKEKRPMSTTRLVQVFVADPDENVPLSKRLLYSGEQKLTDLTDQELFFEIDIKTILDKHNAERITVVNKAVKERTEYLEPARIRDLKMTVVSIASF